MVGWKRSGLVTLICLSANFAVLSPPTDATTVFDAYRRVEGAEYARRLEPELSADLDAGSQLAARAALAIGRTKQRSGASALLAHLTATDPTVRAMCAYGLGLLSVASALEPERKLGRGDRSSAVRYAAIDAIGRIVSENPVLARPAVAADLEHVLRTDADPDVRGHAAAQLEVFGAVPFAAQLARELERSFTRERDEAVRWHIMWSLYRGFAKRAEPGFLDAALRDRDELVRIEAVRAWGRRSDARAVTFARLALGDPSWRVQLEAREVQKHLRGQAPTAHLTRDPAGLHLPPLSAPQSAPRPTFSKPAALDGPQRPDPATFPLALLEPTTAAQMNGALPGRHPRVLIRTTKGDVVVRLYPEWAPSTVANFLALASGGYFDGNRWFRIVPDFVVQTGDPHDNQDGDAGYTIPAEENPVEQRSFVIAMGLNYTGNRALRDSAGTQFYVTLSPQLHLDRAFSVFGEVESGQKVLAHLIERDRMLVVRRITDQ